MSEIVEELKCGPAIHAVHDCTMMIDGKAMRVGGP